MDAVELLEWNWQLRTKLICSNCLPLIGWRVSSVIDPRSTVRRGTLITVAVSICKIRLSRLYLQAQVVVASRRVLPSG